MIQYSEIFRSIQGEGPYTGRPTLWIRFFSCNLQCDGFGQDDPSSPETYELPYQKIDVDDITNIEDLPVFERGCDSSYSWSAKFKHLQHKETVEEVVDKLLGLIPGQDISRWDLCFTGGEPLLKRNQKQVVSILEELNRRDVRFEHITFETNGTQMASDELKKTLQWYGCTHTFSISPKLFNVSGELPEKAINIDAIISLFDFADVAYLKFVCDDKEATWMELQRIVSLLKINTDHPFEYEIWIMPVGATKEGQEDIAARVADKALDHGYCVSARVHSYIWGNQIGT